MRHTVLVAITAAIGNMLRGWDITTITSIALYIKREFHLEASPVMEVLLVAMSVFGTAIITTLYGWVSDVVGRRPMLIASSHLYFAGGLIIMLWSRNFYVLLLGRLLEVLGVGLAAMFIPV
ncbi:hypothetical protein GUJ93_ZPchr0008g13229 [Zizania palustris]|uniref:Major facilitator superfamily (MFS) profile domain-containing protein n=1 Tax=Zizania palustris TaxID=103762 RepID=A0A8J5QYZ8_ZIZPA|nr:hypothetical protein GUJ93_ZPchr0008g13229 [Zizania palustris]